MTGDKIFIFKKPDKSDLSGVIFHFKFQIIDFYPIKNQENYFQKLKINKKIMDVDRNSAILIRILQFQLEICNFDR